MWLELVGWFGCVEETRGALSVVIAINPLSMRRLWGKERYI